MQNIKDFLESKNTYNKVLDILNLRSSNKLLELTNGGDYFIAGGSVSNALIALYHKDRKQCVINDIDIYKRVNHGNVIPREEWYPTVYINEDRLDIVDDSYGNIFITENGSRMRVKKHSRKGIFNIIEYIYEEKTYNRKGLKTKETIILDGFDLNCCKAGMDLRNQKIIYTQEFVEFLETKILKITSPCAPIQTTIRLHKKMIDLDCTCNIEQEIRFLTAAFKSVDKNEITRYIGPETYNKYLGMRDIIDKYFTLKRPERRELPLNLRRKGDCNIWLFEPKMSFEITEQAHTVNTFKRVWNLLYVNKNTEDQDKINTIFYKSVLKGLSHNDELNYTFDMLIINPNYYKCDFDIFHLDFIDKFIESFPEMRIFVMNCKTVIEQYDLLIFIESLIRKEGNWVILFLQTIKYHIFTTSKLFGYETLIKPKLIDVDNIINIIKIEKKFREANRLMKFSLEKQQFIKRQDIYF